jgi:hypothetical protein
MRLKSPENHTENRTRSLGHAQGELEKSKGPNAATIPSLSGEVTDH